VDGNTVKLRFDHTNGGLVAKGDKLVGFSVAGEDKKFVWADAIIKGKSILVSSPDVPNPVAVRYGWADNPDATLYNGAGLPAVPFRTDTWPGITDPKK
jgi:sialate O-acetylesterase